MRKINGGSRSHHSNNPYREISMSNVQQAIGTLPSNPTDGDQTMVSDDLPSHLSQLRNTSLLLPITFIGRCLAPTFTILRTGTAFYLVIMKSVQIRPTMNPQSLNRQILVSDDVLQSLGVFSFSSAGVCL